MINVRASSNVYISCGNFDFPGHWVNSTVFLGVKPPTENSSIYKIVPKTRLASSLGKGISVQCRQYNDIWNHRSVYSVSELEI